jgi:competence protein ComEC
MRRVIAFTVLAACGGTPATEAPVVVATCPGSAFVVQPAPSASHAETFARTKPQAACGGQPLRLHFYNVAQALSVLVDLPDGRHILVDSADAANRAGCGLPCQTAHRHLVSKLATDLRSAPIDLLWITHQHSDHIGGALDLINHPFDIKHYVDNGRDLDVAEIKKTRDALTAKQIPIAVIEPGHTSVPIGDGADVKMTALAPTQWLAGCKEDRNLCSILLRLDYCSSSVLFTGDAETQEEALLDVRPATLLQVGHHGSDTSSSAPFLAKVQPKYAVISAGKPGEGMNTTYCHPRASTVSALTQALGGPGKDSVEAFDAKVSCKGADDSHWQTTATSDRMWATERDGDVILVTTGDGASGNVPSAVEIEWRRTSNYAAFFEASMDAGLMS